MIESNAERLERISNLTIHRDAIKHNFRAVDEVDFMWLIEQAEQARELMLVNKDIVDRAQHLERLVIGLEDSLRIYKEENDKYEQSTHIDNFMYEMSVNQEGVIPCLIKANGIEHSFEITERDVKSLAFILRAVKT